MELNVLHLLKWSQIKPNLAQMDKAPPPHKVGGNMGFFGLHGVLGSPGAFGASDVPGILEPLKLLESLGQLQPLIALEPLELKFSRSRGGTGFKAPGGYRGTWSFAGKELTGLQRHQKFWGGKEVTSILCFYTVLYNCLLKLQFFLPICKSILYLKKSKINQWE